MSPGRSTGRMAERAALESGSAAPETAAFRSAEVGPILHFLTDADDPAGVVATLLGALAPGSYVVASHVTPEHDPAGVGGLERTYRQAGIPAQARTAAEFAALAFRGLEMIEPGVVLVSEWRPPAGPRPPAAEVNWYGGIGRTTGCGPA